MISSLNLDPRVFAIQVPEFEGVSEILLKSTVATTGLILGLLPANDRRRRYKVTAFLIGWVQT